MIEAVERKEQHSNYVSRFPTSSSVKYLTSKHVVKWIEKHHLIEMLLGSDSHTELIKRTPPILKFLV